MNEFLSNSLNPIKIVDTKPEDPGNVKQEDKMTNGKEPKTYDEIHQPQIIQYQPSLNTFVTSINPETRHIDKVKRIAAELDEKYDYYQQHPESHPNYHSEWRNWYLKQKGAAAKGENLQEWIKYWKDRANMLKEKEFENLRSNVVRKDERAAEIEKIVNSDVSDVSTLSLSYSPSSLSSPNQAESEKEEECIIVEQERVLIEVSDDDDSGVQSSPKRQKLAASEEPSSKKKTLMKITLSEKERMVIAIQIAHQIFVENRQPEPEELEKLVNIYCDEGKPLKVDNRHEIFDFSDLSNDDFTVLYKNFEKLNQEEQNNYMAALKIIEKDHPERFSGISEKLKTNEAN
jgi:hypothetical protein